MKIVTKALAVIICASIGILFFCLYNNWLIVTLSLPNRNKPTIPLVTSATKKEIIVWYFQKHRFMSEKKSLLWTQSLSTNISYVIESWLNLLDEEGLVRKKSSLQACCLTASHQELILSFDRLPFDKEMSTRSKLMIIESLLTTLRALDTPIQNVRFLIHHAAAHDPHLDFSRSWPLTGFLVKSAPQETNYSIRIGKDDTPCTIMLDPSGDAQHTGRIIGDSFERGISLQCAEHIKAYIESKLPDVRVILSRLPGETIEMLQNASFANRLNVTLYVNLQFYHESGPERPVSLYHVTYDPTHDLLRSPPQLSWTPPALVYLRNIQESFAWAHSVSKILLSLRLPAGYSVRQPQGLPCKPLIGVIAPACSIEIGLHNKDDWHELAGPIALSLCTIISQHSKNYTPSPS